MHTPVFSSALKGTLYGVVLNDRGSLERIGAALSEAPYKAPPKAPVLYIKPANTFAADGASIVLPPSTDSLEIGATIGVLIGKTASRLQPGDCAAAIAGYLIVADLSIPHESYYRPAIREKCFDASCVIANAPVPASAIAAPDRLDIHTAVNGKTVDRWSLQELVRDIPTLLCELTDYMTLQSGDVMLVGVKWKAPLAKAGDKVAISVAGMGEISFSITAYAAEGQA
jgi:5-oxopent-3-ene-1,2,5-tricarboxylate decarboxylase/2-hydroxyhepta-2,4-diene-1,7-dioate isomerase